MIGREARQTDADLRVRITNLISSRLRFTLKPREGYPPPAWYLGFASCRSLGEGHTFALRL